MFYYPTTLDRFFSDFTESNTTWSPACEVEEADNQYLLSLETAGVPKDRLKLEVVDHQLVVSGERETNQKSKREDGWYSERKYGKFQRSFTLPEGVDGAKIAAHYENGILKVAIPKAPAAKPLTIQIAEESQNKIA